MFNLFPFIVKCLYSIVKEKAENLLISDMLVGIQFVID